MMLLGPPVGVRLLERFGPSITCVSRSFRYQALILTLTFLSYCSYHLSRRPLTVVKSVLAPNCSQLTPPVGTNQSDDTWCAWAPFNVENPNHLFGLLDSFYLFSYAFFMFLSGFVAERCHLRYFLALGMILSGFFTYAFGLAYYYNIHSLWFFIIVQVLNGLFQTTGWPAVVAAVGNWCPKSSRGIIFGIWNSHTNFGNMLGAFIAGWFLEYNWGLSFIVPGAIIAFVGFINFLFLVPYPEEVNLPSVNDQPSSKRTRSVNNSYQSYERGPSNSQRVVYRGGDDEIQPEEEPLIEEVEHKDKKEAVSFWSALAIPGVVEFSLCLFFSKLVNYTFLYWLPMYIKASTNFDSEQSAIFSMAFDFGGIFGAILIGVIADLSGSSGLSCVLMLFLTIPALIVFINFGTISNTFNFMMQVVLGSLVNGPYALITTAVAADLGSKVTCSQALATVTAIIDGTGSIGAAIGPLLAGFIADYSWSDVFYMVLIADVIAMLLLYRIVIAEVTKLRRKLSSANH